MTQKALLVGINAYSPPINPLRGCLNDVQQMQSVLQQYYGFPAENVRLLRDEEATRQGMLDGLAWLTYTAPFAVSSEGEHTLEYYSVDKCGNAETPESPVSTRPMPASSWQHSCRKGRPHGQESGDFA